MENRTNIMDRKSVKFERYKEQNRMQPCCILQTTRKNPRKATSLEEGEKCPCFEKLTNDSNAAVEDY